MLVYMLVKKRSKKTTANEEKWEEGKERWREAEWIVCYKTKITNKHKTTKTMVCTSLVSNPDSEGGSFTKCSPYAGRRSTAPPGLRRLLRVRVLVMEDDRVPRPQILLSFDGSLTLH